MQLIDSNPSQTGLIFKDVVTRLEDVESKFKAGAMPAREALDTFGDILSETLAMFQSQVLGAETNYQETRDIMAQVVEKTNALINLAGYTYLSEK